MKAKMQMSLFLYQSIVTKALLAKSFIHKGQCCKVKQQNIKKQENKKKEYQCKGCKIMYIDFIE